MTVDWDHLVLEPCQDVFGEKVCWKSADGSFNKILSGIFDRGYKPIEILGGEEGFNPSHLTTSRPILGVRSSSFPAGYPLQGDIFLIREKKYVVQEVQPDSHGGLHLVLNEGDAPFEKPIKTPRFKKPWEEE